MATLVFKKTIIEDTHLTLIGIPFKVEANNSLIFLPLQTFLDKSYDHQELSAPFQNRIAGSTHCVPPYTLD